MVNRAFKFLSQEISGLHQAAYLLGTFAIFSQFLALFRDRLLAHFFGAGQLLDIYYAAFRVPDFIFVSVASTVSLSVLIPFLTTKTTQGKDEERQFLNTIFSFFFLLICVVDGAMFFLLPYILPHLFAGFETSEYPLLITASRILLLSPFFLGLSNFFASITQVYKRFFIYAISPLLYNVGIILGIVVLRPYFGIYGVLYGVIFGAVLHFSIQIPFVIKQGLFPRIQMPEWHIIKRVLALSFPRTITLGMTHIAILFLLSFASYLPKGSIAIFNFSYNLQSVPLSIVGVSYSLAAFPTLSRWYVTAQYKKFFQYLVSSAQHIVFWSVPVTALFIVLRAQIVRTILGSGQFSWSDTRLTAAALSIFAVSVTFQSLTALFIRGHYATGRTRLPLVISLISGVTIIASSYGLLKLYAFSNTFRFFIEALLKVQNTEGSQVLMLALGYSIGVSINGILLWISWEDEFKELSRPLFRTVFDTFASSVIMAFVGYIFLNILSNVFDINTTIGIFLQGFLSGIASIIVGVFVLYCLNNKQLIEVGRAFHKKIWKTQKTIIGPDPDVTS